MPSLAEYYRRGLRIDAEPGTRFRYTNHGFATLGQIVEDVSGQPLDRYLREHIFEPLGMADTDLVRSERVPAAPGHRATTCAPVAPSGRRLRGGDGRALPPPTPPRETWPATSRPCSAAAPTSTARCSSRRPWPAMFEPHYQPDPRIPGMGLAFFRADAGGHPRRRARGDPARLRLADLPGARRRRRGAGLHQRGPARHALAAGRDRGPAQPAARRPRRGDPHRRPAAPRDLGRPLRLVPASRPTRPMPVRGCDARRRGRGLRPPRPAHAPVPDPDPRAVPGLSCCTPTTTRTRTCSGSTCPGLDAPPASCSAANPGPGPRSPPRSDAAVAPQATATTNPRRWATGALGALAVATTATAARRHSRPYKGEAK